MLSRSTGATILALTVSAAGYVAPHAHTHRSRRCGAPVNTCAAAKSAWLAKQAPVLSIPDTLAAFAGPAASTQHEFVSLEETFSPEFAERFHASPEFRSDLIDCASDVGSLFSRLTPWAAQAPDFDEDGCRGRLGAVLACHLGASAPTADEFVGAFSALCGDGFRWGAFHSFAVKDSFFESAPGPFAQEWHQDWAAAEISHMFGESRTVMFAFPAAGSSDHEGTGVFTELIKLTHEFVTETLKATTSRYQGLATDEADRKAAAELGVTNAHIVRPYYRRGQEMLRYKDSEHLHRSPRGISDPTGRRRQAIWRFQ